MTQQWLDDIIQDKGQKWLDKRRREARDSYQHGDHMTYHAFENAYIKRMYIWEKQQEAVVEGAD